MISVDVKIFNPGANYTSFPGPAIIPPFSANSSGGVLMTGRAPTTTTMELPGPSQTPKPFTNVHLGVVESVIIPGTDSSSTGFASSSSSTSSAKVGNGPSSLTPSRPSVSPKPSPSCRDSKKKRDLGITRGMKTKKHVHIAREERPKVLSRIMLNLDAGH